MTAGHTTISYADFQRLMGEYTDHIMAVVIRSERNRPEPEQLEAKVAAVKAKDAIWDAICHRPDEEGA